MISNEKILGAVAYIVMVGMMFAGLFAWWFGRQK